MNYFIYIKIMGIFLIDQFSLLHFSVGVIFYFWNFSLLNSFLLHLSFEIFENTTYGIHFIQSLFIKPRLFHYPGGKSKPDTLTNIFGDNLFFLLGWILAYFADFYSLKFKLYPI